MTDLSPQAQAVLNAFNQEKGWLFPVEIVGSKVAAALRAAADQMSAHHSKTFLYSIADYWKLRSIADELENHND